VFTLDVCSCLNGVFGDTSVTCALGNVKPEVMDLLCVTDTTLHRAIDAAKYGNRIGDIGHAVQQYCEKEHSYSVVRELVGHGIGKDLHESPEVPNFGKRGKGPKIKEGLVIAIEPMINLGRKEVRQSKDGWTITTKDKTPSAHFEHTVAVLKDTTRVLSNHSPIHAAIRQNDAVQEVVLKGEYAAIGSPAAGV